MDTKKIIFITLLLLYRNTVPMNHSTTISTIIDNVHARSETTGKTYLHNAAEKGSIDEIHYAYSKHAYINAQDRNGNTALHLAIANKKKDAALLLIQYGINSNIVNNQWDCPIRSIFESIGVTPVDEPALEDRQLMNAIHSAILYKKLCLLQMHQDALSLWNIKLIRYYKRHRPTIRKRSKTL